MKTPSRRNSRCSAGVEQLVAPIDRRPQRLLPCRPIARAAVERQALAGHPRQQRLGRDHLDPRRGQLDGERQPVEGQTDVGDCARVLVGQREAGARGPGPLDKQPHGRHVGHRRRAADTRPVRNHERRHLILVFGADVQARAARRQNFDPLAALDERRHFQRSGGNVLEVVEDEEQRRIERAQVPCHRRPRRLAGAGVDVEHQHEARHQMVGVGDTGERHEIRRAREGVAHRARHVRRQPRLADSARTGERDPPHVRPLEQGLHRGGVRVAAHQARGRGREVGGRQHRRR